MTLASLGKCAAGNCLPIVSSQCLSSLPVHSTGGAVENARSAKFTVASATAIGGVPVWKISAGLAQTAISNNIAAKASNCVIYFTLGSEAPRRSLLGLGPTKSSKDVCVKPSHDPEWPHA